jgi:hypothetical protein
VIGLLRIKLADTCGIEKISTPFGVVTHNSWLCAPDNFPTESLDFQVEGRPIRTATVKVEPVQIINPAVPEPRLVKPVTASRKKGKN